MSELHPTIEFTASFPKPTGTLPYSDTFVNYLLQYSSWYPTLNANVVNANITQGQTFVLSGKHALYFKNIVDKGNVPFTYKFVPYPQLSSALPTGYLSGNDYVTLTGLNLNGIINTKFGAVNSQWSVPQSNTQVSTWAFPVSSPQTVNVTVRNRTDSATIPYSFVYKAIEGTVTSYPLAGAVPYFTWTGPDGNIWVADQGSAVWKVTPAGIATKYVTPHPIFNIIGGPDGNLWATTTNGVSSVIAKISTSGVILATYTITNPNAAFGANSLCVGPDSNIWASGYNFNTFTSGFVWKIDLSGQITEYDVSTGPVQQIVSGPDGNLWFTAGASTLLKITTVGVITPVVTIPGASFYVAMCVGPDGNFWMVNLTFSPFSGGIYVITPTGDYTFINLGLNAEIQGVCAGPDGNIWMADFNRASIWKVTSNGIATEYPGGGSNNSIIVGSDGNLWMADSGGNVVKVS